MARLFLLLFAAFALAQSPFPRVGVHGASEAGPGFTRLVFDGAVTYRMNREGGLLVLFFPGLSASAQDQVVNSAEVASVQTLPEPGGVRVVVRLKREGVEVKESRLKEPDRLVLDLYAPPAPIPQARTASPSGEQRKDPPPKRAVVVLDPGHGGVDPGMVGYVVEKEVTLDVALRLKKLLEAQGIQVRLTRDRDAHLSPDKRTDLSRRAAMADSSQVNLFISIHVNATPTRTARGVEVFYFGQTQSQEVLQRVIWENGGGELGRRLTEEARTAAQKVLTDVLAQANQRYSQSLAETLGRLLSQATGSPYRGSFPGDLFVLRYARVPAVLVEIGFGDHPVEGRLLSDGAYRQKVAEGLLSGVLRFLAAGAFGYR
ncbi:N-acetylmuramoyl-L-alanine amidase family protein [Thermus filiformis]|uniref:N-acetylmuramoyl-L-alanine amidase n=1 Tax=Thermus filiformis TaxID=276 RepID=A0A0A2WR72_THEFI|nr:N-acetylmuramoyl-L-alanine amidase [Thermus filiformis]KGQ21247.1 N-acetylmuramoyl-L-alanine amidase [Thermus filiformis]